MPGAGRLNPRWSSLPDDGDRLDEAAPPSVRRLAVVGAGQMGAGIAEVAVRAGVEVMIVEVDDGAAEAGRDRIAASLRRAVGAGKLSDEVAAQALERISFTTEWQALDGADAAIEAVVEDEHEKRRVFAQLDASLPGALFLASNTSSVPIMKLASATKRPERVLGLHFFNPVAVMKLVEVVPSLMTAPDTVSLAQDFAAGVLGKDVIRAPDRAGFVVNALLVPYLLCAIRMVEAGPSSHEEIDRGMVAGCHHPMGPLALSDLIGLDTVLAVSESLYDEFHEPFYSAPPLLRRMVEAGRVGRKAGAGFYSYDGAAPLAPAAA
jgi:3-hydroxybutyryl-CoA dehydrogenase